MTHHSVCIVVPIGKVTLKVTLNKARRKKITPNTTAKCGVERFFLLGRRKANWQAHIKKKFIWQHFSPGIKTTCGKTIWRFHSKEASATSPTNTKREQLCEEPRRGGDLKTDPTTKALEKPKGWPIQRLSLWILLSGRDQSYIGSRSFLHMLLMSMSALDGHCQLPIPGRNLWKPCMISMQGFGVARGLH